MTRFLDIESFPSLHEAGFLGGRDSFRDFCKTIFRSGEPRFLRTDQNQLVVFRHRDLQAFGTSPEVGNLPIGKLYPGRFTSAGEPEDGPGAEVARVIGAQVFAFNPPLHAPARRILLDWIGPKQVAGIEGLARRAAQDTIAAIPDDTEFDFLAAVTESFTSRFWGSLLHMTGEEIARVGECARDMTRLFSIKRMAGDLDILDRAFARYAHLLDIAAERSLAAGDPALAEIAAKLRRLDFPDDPFEVGVVPRTLGAMLAGNLVDGFHTAAHASANAVYVLLNHPEALKAVRASPDILPKAIAEALRLEPPVAVLKRYVLGDFHHDGFVVPRGSVVNMLWAAGNHDPEAFPNPEKFDLTRPRTGLTTFGNGAHICPGRYVGLMLTRVLLETLASEDIELQRSAAPAEWLPGHIMNQLSIMPMVMRRRGPTPRVGRSARP
jgi:cytochrome P450